jgi:hypothetical protein
MARAERILKRRRRADEAAQQQVHDATAAAERGEARRLADELRPYIEVFVKQMARAGYPDAHLLNLALGLGGRRIKKACWEVHSHQGSWDRDGYSTVTIYLDAEGRLITTTAWSTGYTRLDDFTPGQLHGIAEGIGVELSERP